MIDMQRKIAGTVHFQCRNCKANWTRHYGADVGVWHSVAAALNSRGPYDWHECEDGTYGISTISKVVPDIAPQRSPKLSGTFQDTSAPVDTTKLVEVPVEADSPEPRVSLEISTESAEPETTDENVDDLPPAILED